MTNANTRMLRPLIAGNAVKPRAPLKGREAVEQMADDMRVANARNGGVTEQEMSLIGWTPAQIATHGEAARVRAQKLAGGFA